MDIFALVLLPLSLALVFYPCLAGTHFLSGFDFTGYWYPFMAHAQDWFHREGTLPFWIPQLFCGMPLGEALGPALFYPTEILGWALRTTPAHFYLADTLFHLLLAGGGAVMLARSLGFGVPAAAVSGLAYMLGGVLMVQVRVGIPVSIRCAALIPWVFVLFNRWQATRDLRPVAGMAALSALMILTGGYQMLAYTLVALLVYSLFLPGRVRSIQALTGIALAGAVLGAVTLIPNARYYFHSLRSGGALDFAGVAPLYFSDIPLLFKPSFRQPVDPERVKYLGLAVTALALLGAARKWRRMSAWLAVLGTAFILALGSQTPVGQAVAGIPILGSFRVPMKWMLFGQLSLALLAGAGASVLTGLRGKTGRILAAALPLLVATDLIRWELRLRKMDSTAPRADVLVDQYIKGSPGAFRIESVEPAPVLNQRMGRGFDWVTGYHTAPLAQFADFYGGASSAGLLPAILPWMNARYLVAGTSQQAGDRYTARNKVDGPDPVFGKEAHYMLCESADYAPRAWLAVGVAQAPAPAETLSLLAKYPPSSGLAVVNSQGITLPRRPGGGTVKFIRQTPNAVDMEASARNDGLLVLSDSFYPAWEARVDGKRVPILRTNWIFRGVEVPAGRHKVAFQWNSVVFNVGLWLSMLSWIILASLAIRRNNS